MSTDDKEKKSGRNFRSSYYNKLRCMGVEEKKSLEILLEEKPINKIKLKQFCLMFSVPAIHRSTLWNILLGIYPNDETNEFFKIQRSAVYNDLLHALQIIGIVDEKTQKSKVFHAMWLLENKKLHLGFNINTDSNFVTITEILLQNFEGYDEMTFVETYWKVKGFYEFTQEIEKEAQRLIAFTFTVLQKEDSILYNNLETIGVLSALPLQQWYTCCFAGIIAEPSIIRIWDKICGGSKKILVFVTVVLFTTLRRQILYCKDLKSLLVAIENIKDDKETADVLVNKAIELWQQNNGHSEFVNTSKR